MNAVFKREFRSYFTGGMGYAFCAVFIFVMNLFYYLNSVLFYQSSFSYIFNIMLIAMVFLIPLMTMRIWSEEKKQKTDQLLLTAPVTTSSIVLGKFFAAMCVFIIALALTFTYPLITLLRGTPEWGEIIGNYIAITLAAGAYVAISQFMSSLTESQIISALLSICTLSMFIFLNILFETNIEVLSQIAAFLSIITRYVNFFQGIFNVADAIYFISLTIVFLFLTSRVIEKRRWN